MNVQPTKTLAELEKIYSGNKNIQSKPDLQFGELKIGKDEFKTQVEAHKIHHDIEIAGNYITDPQSNTNKKDLIEIRAFLPTFAEKMISSRYENPLKDLRISTKRWKIYTFLLALTSIAYFSVHLWATLTLSNVEVLSKAPRAILQASSILLKMQDLLYYNYTVNIVLDCWALVLYSALMIKLFRESSTEISNEEEEKGRLKKIMSAILILAVVLFGLSYISGTVFLFMTQEIHSEAGAYITLIAFHVIKLVYLLLNVIAIRKYKYKKLIYEDLLLEAMGPSDSGDEESKDENRDNFDNNYLP